MQFKPSEYESLKTTNFASSKDIFIIDHLGGFRPDLTNSILDTLAERKIPNTIYLQYIPDDRLKEKYKSINIQFSAKLQHNINFLQHKNYTVHPTVNFKNFICSFNGSAHVSRKLLVSILKKFGWFDVNYCSKNCCYTSDVLDGHVSDYTYDQATYYRKFFINYDSEKFFQTINSFGHVQFDHASNIYNLESKLTRSFLHVVSETLATSYYPFVTEKFLYSIVTRGLFLAYAQPGWHTHLENYYGFRKYNRLFDYRFDTIQNPVERLVELMTMISKFSMLSTDDWQDLYELEKDTIEYNYDHYFSGDYLKTLQLYV